MPGMAAGRGRAMITRRRRRTEPPRRATWTFAVYYMRDKGQTLWLLSSMTEFALENVMAMVRSDMPCIGCAEPYDLADRITPHAVIFAVHPAGHSWTASLCRACVVDECQGDRQAVLRLA